MTCDVFQIILNILWIIISAALSVIAVSMAVVVYHIVFSKEKSNHQTKRT